MSAAIAPLVIAAISLCVRLLNLSTPKGFVFDEVYYVDGARDLLAYGVEVSGKGPEFVVHPPVGKWMIALGIKIFGDNEFGWRFSSAIIGTLLILLIALIAHKLFYSPLLTALAAALAALDGLALVHSRTALLDLFLTFFTTCAVYFWLQRKRWWMGFFLGLALSTKWSGLYFLLLIGAVALYRIFVLFPPRQMLKPLVNTFLTTLVLPLGIYIASWSGWFLSKRGWDRTWSNSIVKSFWHYHAEILNFHTTLTEKHTYQANPWSWLVQGRPTSFFYASPKGCSSASCSQEVLALGTPLLWWAATIALFVVVGLWIKSLYLHRSDRALNLIVLGVGAGYLPWFFFQKRTVFSFYAIVFEPFMILALVYCAKRLLSIKGREGIAQIAVGVFVALVFLNFIYFFPLFRGEVITYDAWHARMWFESWI